MQPPSKTDSRANSSLLVLIEQVVRPFDRRAQGLLPQVGVTAAAQQVEPLPETRQQLFGRENRRPRRRELERQWKVVQAVAEFVECGARLELGLHGARTSDEQRPSVRAIEHRNRIYVLAADLQPLAARHEQVEVRASREELREVRGGSDHVLEVVEEEKQSPLTDRFGERAGGPETACRASKTDSASRTGASGTHHTPCG